MQPLLGILAQTAPDTDAVQDAVPDSLGLADWLTSLAIFVVSIVLAIILRRVVNRYIERRTPVTAAATATASLVSRVVGTVVVIAGFIYSLSYIGVQVGLFLGALGIGGIALAFAFQDILENFIAGFILQVKRPFVPRDYVEIGEKQLFGIVKEVDSRSVVIDTFGGDRIIVPAAEVLKNAIVNWTARGRHRLPVEIGIHYRTTPHEAIEVITPRIQDIDEVLSEPAARVLCSRLDDSAVVLTAYVWHDAFADVFWVQHRVIEEAKQALDDAGIEIPFPQRVLSLSPESPGLDRDQRSDATSSDRHQSSSVSAGPRRPGAARRA